MKKYFYLKKKNFYSYSFFPFIVVLFKEDIVQLVELVKSNYPEAKIYFGKDGLDFDLLSRLEAEDLFKNEEITKNVYNSIYIRINTDNKEDAPYLIVELDQYSFNFIISGRDKKLFKIKREIIKIFKRNRVYKFIQNRIVISIILFIDLSFFPVVLKFRESIEKFLNFSISYISILLIFIMINMIFILPSGKNRIYLKPKKKVSLFSRARETVVFIGIFLIFLSFFAIGFFLKIL